MNLLPKHWAITGCVAVLSASLCPAQSSATMTKDDFAPSKLELDFFTGGQLFHKRPDPLQTKLLNSMVFGTRLTENLWRYWSLEQSFSGSTLADLTLLPIAGAGGAQRVDLEQRVWKFGFNPVYHLTPRGSRIRPYLTLGYTQAYYAAADAGKVTAAQLTPVPATTFKSTARPAMNYGGGFKWRLTDLVNARFDVRGLWSSAPRWGLPESLTGQRAGSLYIPTGGSLHGMEATGGIGFNFGGRGSNGGGRVIPKKADAPPPVAPTPEPTKPAPAARTFELSPLQVTPPTGFAGDTFTFSTKLTDSMNAPGIRYVWTVDGVEQSGANGPEFKTSTLTAGAHQIKATATDPATGTTASTAPYSMTVNPAPPLTVTISADKTTLKAGETARLTAQASENAYSGPLTYTWKTNAGTTQGTGSSVTFVSSSVNFDPANVFKPESRAATITATVTDQRGRTATSDPVQINVSKDPQAMRLDDLVYGKGSARVNNCAKRILIDELQALMNNNPDVEVLLIGHTDAAEPTKGAKGRVLNLDKQRVYNAAAVLTAGTGVCAKCDLSRIKVAYAGTEQSSDFRSGFCGTSTRQKSDERKADEIAADDAAAKNRRVEIWIVPKGVTMPGGAKDVQAAPGERDQSQGLPQVVRKRAIGRPLPSRDRAAFSYCADARKRRNSSATKISFNASSFACNRRNRSSNSLKVQKSSMFSREYGNGLGLPYSRR